MSKFFRITAIILLIISAFVLLVGLIDLGEPEAIWVAFSGLVSAVAGLSLYTVGDLLDRVNYLEDRLNIHLPIEKSEDDLPQVKCKKCRTEYDMDYPKCPCCGTPTELNNN